jgi:hypothetical protein
VEAQVRDRIFIDIKAVEIDAAAGFFVLIVGSLAPVAFTEEDKADIVPRDAIGEIFPGKAATGQFVLIYSLAPAAFTDIIVDIPL